MKLVKPEVTYYGELPVDRPSAVKFIELAGRTCYKSEKNITDSSAEKFVKRLIKAGHLAMVEHSNFVVRIPWGCDPTLFEAFSQDCRYLSYVEKEDFFYVGGNLTAWFNAYTAVSKRLGGALWNDSMFQPLTETYGDLFGFQIKDSGVQWELCNQEDIPDELKRYAVKLICDRGVTHEIVRHRPCSFAQESTRYVNYGGKDMEFIEPADYDEWPETAKSKLETAFEINSIAYNALLKEGCKPEQARAVLPNSLKTEIVISADAKEWSHIRKLRTHASAHPDMVRVMNMMPWDDILLSRNTHD